MKENFYSALALANDLYGVELDEDQFETWGMVGWNKIGNKDYILKHFIGHPEPQKDGGWAICKPCDLNQIEAITLPYEDAQTTSSVINYPEVYTREIENWIEGNKTMPNALYISGKFVKYTEIGDKIYFTEPFASVHVLYKSFKMDSDSLPYLNEKEKFAIATYVAYCYFYKKGLMTRDANTIQIAQALKQDWFRACDDARNPEYLSQNSVNEILDRMTSFDAHSYGRTTKPIQ